MIYIYVCSESDWLTFTLRMIPMLKMMVPARWETDSFILTLPHLQHHMIYLFS